MAFSSSSKDIEVDLKSLSIDLYADVAKSNKVLTSRTQWFQRSYRDAVGQLSIDGRKVQQRDECQSHKTFHGHFPKLAPSGGWRTYTTSHLGRCKTGWKQCLEFKAGVAAMKPILTSVASAPTQQYYHGLQQEAYSVE